LRKLSQLETKLLEHKIDPTLPTLFLSECVLIYVNTTYSAALIKWSTTFFAESMFVIYEQINPNDAFGKMMVTNLEVCIYTGVFAESKRKEESL
jgi:O-methyltransferase involved in polyketide biosynthesis